MSSGPATGVGESSGAGGASPSLQGPQSEGSGPSRSSPVWLQIFPFFLSATLYLSAFFAVFCPLPILLLQVRRGRAWAFLAALTNTGLVLFAAGGVSALIYVVFGVAVALTLGETLTRSRSINRAAGLTLGVMVAAAALILVGYAQIKGVHPWVELRGTVSHFVETLDQAMTQDQGRAPVDPADLELWKQNLMAELPSAVAVLALIVVWANLTLLIRINPAGIRERLGIRPDILENWRAPEWLVWPTIATGATLLFDGGWVSEVGRNLFRFLMAIYAVQGLSVLSFFFGLWKIKRGLRMVGYAVSVLLMTPLVLSIGFFDLWFDFRAKFRQS